MDVKQVLEAAQQLVAERWCRGNYSDGRGNYCAAGAINLAAGEMVARNGSLTYADHADEPDRGLRFKRLAWDARTVLMDCLPTPFESIATYNDDPGTSQQDVLAVFDKAISSC